MVFSISMEGVLNNKYIKTKFFSKQKYILTLNRMNNIDNKLKTILCIINNFNLLKKSLLKYI